MKKGRVNAKYEEKYVKANRTFPVGKTVLLVLVLLVQIFVIVAVAKFEPEPQDIIREYDVIVEALDDGSLDITYHFVWEAVDPYEELTLVEIGMANANYFVYPNSVSDTISKYEKEDYDGEVYLVLDLDRAYYGGEVLEFFFKVNQKDMLCVDAGGYLYEFIPGWFNSTPVEHYTFRWATDGRSCHAAAQKQDGYYVWSGSWECGEYTTMAVRYDNGTFVNANVVPHIPFDDSGVYNALEEDKYAMIGLAAILVIVLVFVQVWVVDSYVSYHRGRGFLSGHGYHVHTYGRSNPHYIKARDRYNATHGGGRGGRGGGGCACACACACAGGGRAGCSQKDTFGK